MADMLPEHSPSARKRMKVYVAEPFAGQPQDPLRVVEAHPRRDGESVSYNLSVIGTLMLSFCQQLYPKVPASYNVGGGLGSRFWKANSWEKSESSREPKPTPTQSPKFPRRGKFLFQPSSSRRALFLPNTVDEGADNITLRHTVSLNRSQLVSREQPESDSRLTYIQSNP